MKIEPYQITRLDSRARDALRPFLPSIHRQIPALHLAFYLKRNLSLSTIVSRLNKLLLTLLLDFSNSINTPSIQFLPHMSSSSDQSSAAINWLNRLAQILYGTFLLIVAPIYLYLSLPVLNPWFLSLPIGIFFISILVLVLELRVINRRKTWLFKLSTLTAVATLLYIVVISIIGWEGFRARSYQHLIGEIRLSENFAEEVPPVPLDQIRIIDQQVAHRLGEKVLGQELPGQERTLGSQAYVGPFNIQMGNGKLYWVAPLLHSGFFKWFNNMDGTPAYIMVSATSDP